MSDGQQNRLTSNEYADIMVRYNNDLNLLTGYDPNESYTIINSTYGLVHIPVDIFKKEAFNQFTWFNIQKCYGLLEASSLEASGIMKIQNVPNLGFFGSGILVGFIDTGIEYTNPVFLNADKTTRIVSIWDQNIESSDSVSEEVPYGTVYTREQINKALSSDNPLEIVPSTDENGHGTMLAGITAGTRSEKDDFYGIVPNAEIAVVKLKPAKDYLKEFYLIPKEADCYQASDIMFAMKYLTKLAQIQNKPIAICIVIGTSSGLHDGEGALSDSISYYADSPGTVVVIAAGNEGNAGSHYYGTIDRKVGYDTVELNVGKNVSGFSMELWGFIPNLYSVEITSPSGETISRIQARINEKREINFLFENTVLFINYVLFEVSTGNQLIFFRFVNPVEGIWKLRVYGSGNIIMNYNIWLPIRNFISSDTRFLNSNPDTTITSPGNALIPITVTAYNHQTGTAYIDASRGYTGVNLIKPDFAAPGVNVYSPSLKNTFQYSTGTSVAAAHTTGVAAMLLEWGIVKNNLPTMSSLEAKNLLIRGARRDPTISYPNKQWGYGILDLYNTYLSFQVE
jgi:subtilisin family serine protease